MYKELRETNLNAEITNKDLLAQIREVTGIKEQSYSSQKVDMFSDA